ncbi:hypothetical protein J0J30_24045, partial [Vibrio vulnificus]|nr:hypothetical protein [Vibrio vulnificus]
MSKQNQANYGNAYGKCCFPNKCACCQTLTIGTEKNKKITYTSLILPKFSDLTFLIQAIPQVLQTPPKTVEI